MTINRATRFVDVFNAIHDAAGLCVICGKRPPRDNRRTCALCSSKRTGAQQHKAEIEEETET